MSGRIRQLKPDFHLDEEFWAFMSQHPEMFLDRAFEGLWCHSDREGRFEWRPQMLKAKILPYWSGDFGRTLEMLAEAGYVVSYVVDGRRYGWVRNFGKHQRPNSREPESTLPPPPVNDPHADVRMRVHACADESPRASLPLPPLPTPDPNTQHPDPVSARAAPPEVPGLTVVGTPSVANTGPLRPSRRETEELSALAAKGATRHEYTPGWAPTRAGNLPRALELGLTEEELWAVWAECRDKHYEHAFRSDEKQFNRELAWFVKDRAKEQFQAQSKRDREAFELPGRERRA